MAVAAHKMAAGPRKEGTLNTCFVRVVDARPRKTMTPQQGFCSNVCVCDPSEFLGLVNPFTDIRTLGATSDSQLGYPTHHGLPPM